MLYIKAVLCKVLKQQVPVPVPVFQVPVLGMQVPVPLPVLS